jgi:hypothetical protein
MAQVLKVAHLAQNHRVAQVDVRRRGVEPDLDRQRPAGELANQVFLIDQVDDATPKDLEVGRAGTHGGRGLYVSHERQDLRNR